MKKNHTNSERLYRRACTQRQGEYTFQVVVEESDLNVVAQLDLARPISLYVTQLRGEIKAWTRLHPEFRTSLVPLDLRELPDTAPEVVRRMTQGAALAGVGPFAAVAGVIAQMTAQYFSAQSPNIIIENGGDIYICSTIDRVVGMLPEPESGSLIGVKVAACDCPVSLCASSAHIGHSLSFGQGDIAVVRAKDASLADAAATALCNRLRQASDVDKALHWAENMAPKGLEGVFLQCAGRMGLWGNMELATV